jgi:DNA-binding transcriptional MocR family regulator
VIEDDHLGPVAGAAALTLTTGRSRWAHVRSTSKWLGPDLRLAVLVGDEHTIRRVEGRQAVGPGWVSTIVQRAVAALWSDEDVLAGAGQAATIYGGRRRALVEALASHGIAATGRSGLNVWIPVEAEDVAGAGLLAAGWAVAAGSRFRLRSGPGIRITVADLRPGEAERLAADLAAVLRPAGRTRAA